MDFAILSGMTLSVRNTLLRVGIAISTLLLAGFGYVSYQILWGDGISGGASALANQHWLVFTWNASEDHVVWSVIGMLLLGLVALVTLSLFVRYFRKITAPEIFFFAVFVLSVALDQLKVAQLWLVIANQPQEIGVVVTRTVLFGHIMGIFSLFASSLYVAGVEYQKTGTILGIAALVAFTLAYTIPVDSLVLLPNLLYRTGDERGLQIVSVILYLLVAVNYVYAMITNGAGETGVLLAAMVLVIVGRELLYYLASPLAVILGGVFLSAGTLVFGTRSHAMYLWI